MFFPLTSAHSTSRQPDEKIRSVFWLVFIRKSHQVEGVELEMESGANTKEVLTPKNVYRFLTDNLPGLYPHGVIPAAERKGLTLVKFWAQVLDGIIPPEWHASLFGGTQRSRLSDMMNRTGVQPLPPKLQQEMNALLSGETLIRLSQQVQDFLRSAHYDPDALTRALPDFVRMMMETRSA